MKSYRKLHEEAMKQVNNYIWAVTHNVTNEEDNDHMEQSESLFSYVFDFPGVAPDRCSAKLSANRKQITIYVDGTAQKVIIPPYDPDRKPEDLSIKMEHGRLTLGISRKPQPLTAENEVSIPINGRQFLQE
jgi:hypothetical protein